VVYPNTPTATVSGGLAKINTQPKYIIEDLGEVPEVGGSKVLPGAYKGKGNTVLRVTARGTGGTDAAQAMVQSTYSRAF
jgi:Tfp pilus assembly protein PilX